MNDTIIHHIPGKQTLLAMRISKAADAAKTQIAEIIGHSHHSDQVGAMNMIVDEISQSLESWAAEHPDAADKDFAEKLAQIQKEKITADGDSQTKLRVSEDKLVLRWMAQALNIDIAFSHAYSRHASTSAMAL